MLWYGVLILVLPHSLCNGSKSPEFSKSHQMSRVDLKEQLLHHRKQILTHQKDSKYQVFRLPVNETEIYSGSPVETKSESGRERRKKNKKGIEKSETELSPQSKYQDQKQNHTQGGETPPRKNRKRGKGKNRKGEKKRKRKPKQKMKNKKPRNNGKIRNETRLDIVSKNQWQGSIPLQLLTSNEANIQEKPVSIDFSTKKKHQPEYLLKPQEDHWKGSDISKNEHVKFLMDDEADNKIRNLERKNIYSSSDSFSLTSNLVSNEEKIKKNSVDNEEDNELRKFYHLVPSWRNSIIHKLANKNYTSDYNECLKDNGGCEGLCINTPGSYHCHCPPGFRLDDSRKKCQDINECLLRNGHGPCQGECENRWGSYRCGCSSIPGTELSADGRTCKTIDSCSRANCSHLCENTRSGPFCFCPPGYVLSSDWKTCEDVDECLQTDLQDTKCSGLCINTEGSYICHYKD